MHVYAHRGLHGGVRRAENTLPAFRAAAAAGLGIETDLRTDADGRLVLFHDRTAGGVAVDAVPLAELARLAGHPVATLDELLALDLPVPLNLEVKTRAAADALLAYRGRLPASAWVSSFIHPVAVELARDLERPGALLLASAPLEPPTPLPGVATLVWDYNMLEPALVERCAAAGWTQFAYGARTAAEHARVRALGCGGLITDWPELALSAA